MAKALKSQYIISCSIKDTGSPYAIAREIALSYRFLPINNTFMTYKPTKEELEELGFTEYALWKYYGRELWDNFAIWYDLSDMDLHFAWDEASKVLVWSQAKAHLWGIYWSVRYNRTVENDC